MHNSRSVSPQDKSAVGLSAVLSGTIRGMSKIDPKDATPQGVGARLRALYAEMSMTTVDEFADVLGVERNRASNWLNGYNLPKTPEMTKLCDITGVTLDWIYRGEPGALPLDKAIRLHALLEEIPEENLVAPKKARRGAASASHKKVKASG